MATVTEDLTATIEAVELIDEGGGEYTLEIEYDDGQKISIKKRPGEGLAELQEKIQTDLVDGTMGKAHLVALGVAWIAATSNNLGHMASRINLLDGKTITRSFTGNSQNIISHN